MAKSKILKEIVNNEISIEVALKRLYVIANDLEDSDLITWVEKELYGYDDKDDVPDYRNIGCGNILYSGIKGTMICNMKIQNCPLPFQAIPKKVQEIIIDNFRRESIATIEKEANSTGIFTYSLADIIPYIDVGVAIASLYRTYSQDVFKEIVNKVSSILLKIFTRLDKTVKNLDELDIGELEKDKEDQLKTFIQKVVFEDNSIHIGDGNKIEKSNITTK